MSGYCKSRVFRHVRLIAATVSACLAVAFPALATVVDVGDAANYGILTGQKESLTFSGNLNLAGNLGIGSNSTLKFTGSGNAISGTEYKDSSVSTSGSASISGGVVTHSMTSAINDAVSAATTLAATPGLVDQGGSINITKSSNSIVIKAVQNASENVLNISALSLTNGSITFDDNHHQRDRRLFHRQQRRDQGDQWRGRG